MSAKRGIAIRVLALIFVLMAVAGVLAVRSQWGHATESAVPYGNAGKSLPVLRALAQEKVTFLRVQDWCRAYSDNHEKRTGELRGTCTLGDGFQLFDNESEKRFRTLTDLLKDLPYRVMWINIEYGPDGEMRTAGLQIDTADPFRRVSLVYGPGRPVPKDISGEVVYHRIDTDWLYVEEDWN